VTGQHLDSQGAVALFTQIGAFDSALQTALALGMDMSNIFEHMALRCVSYSQSGIEDEYVELTLSNQLRILIFPSCTERMQSGSIKIAAHLIGKDR
jgi:hypothetical protein